MNIKELRRAARYAFGRRFVEASLRLPRAISRPLYGALGELAFLFVARDRRIALENIRHACPGLTDREVRSMARSVFRNLLRNIHDVGAAARWSAAEKDARLDVLGLAKLEAALAEGRGAVLFGGHQGAWELVAVALARHGVRLTSMARPIREKRLDRWLTEHRRALGIATLSRGGLSAARDARRVLARGEALGILLDHRIRKGGVVCDFFGRPARFSAGPIRLALRTGAPLIPVHISGRPGGHTITIGDPVACALPGTPARDRVTVAVRAAVAALEAMIRRSPAEWAWIHPRWHRESRRPMERPLPARDAGSPVLTRSTVLVAATASLIFAGCEASRNTGSVVADRSGPSSAMANFKVRETVGGRLKWILTADSAETWDEVRETLVQGVNVDFYAADGTVNSVLKADTGVLHAASNNLTGRGNVTLTSAAGDTLTTEQLDWDNQAGRIRTSEKFRLARPGGWITGTGFESDPDLRNYTTEDVRIDARPGTGGGR